MLTKHMVCRGICVRYKHQRHGTDRIYKKDVSRCNGFCHLFILWSGLFCPCCEIRLRKTSRSKYGTIRKNIEAKRY